MAESKKKFTTETLLKQIPVDKCWALTAKFLGTFAVLQGEKRVAPELGKSEGIISPVLGVEKWYEIDIKGWGEDALVRRFFPWVKETFSIPVEDAIGAAKLMWVAYTLYCGPELKGRIVEATPERVVVRWIKCSWWNRYKEHEVGHDVISCYPVHEAVTEAGLKAINPKLTYKLTKAMPLGDPYCEDIIEFKEE